MHKISPWCLPARATPLSVHPPNAPSAERTPTAARMEKEKRKTCRRAGVVLVRRGGVRIGRKVGELRMISWGLSCGIQSAGEHDDDVYVLFQQSLQISSNN